LLLGRPLFITFAVVVVLVVVAAERESLSSFRCCLSQGMAIVGVSMWLRNKHDSSPNNCFFVLPNLSIDGSEGVAIELMHSICIDWDGSIIKHCTSVPNLSSDEVLLGIFLGGKSKFMHGLRGRLDHP